MPARLFLDLSVLLRWTGPPVGISRVEAEFARYGLGRGDTGFIFFDTRTNMFRTVEPDLVSDLLAGKIAVDMHGMPDPRPVRRNAVGALIHQLDRRLTPVTRPRRFVIRQLEQIRRRLPEGGVRSAIDSTQQLFFSPKHRMFFFDQEGQRRSFVTTDEALGPPATLGPDAVVLSAGADWNTKNPLVLKTLKQRHGWRLAMATYDLIPVNMPAYFPARDVAVFTNYFRHALSYVDRFVCISQATACELRDFAARENLRLRDVQVEPLGANPPARAIGGELPPGLVPKRYALFVSTVEPRKNHLLLLRAWQMLNRQGIPARSGFKLIFVGRMGWHMETFGAALAATENVAHLTNVGDNQLALLYQHAGFCLYPPLYEGYGLPVIEALSHGRAIIASTGGAIPEAVGGFGPCLDPKDETVWANTIAEWIANPGIVEAHEARIRASFRPVTWQESAEKYFRQALGVFEAPVQSI